MLYFGLLDMRPRFKSHVRHQNENILIGRFLAKILKINKIAMKGFVKNCLFGIDLKSIGPTTYV